MSTKKPPSGDPGAGIGAGATAFSKGQSDATQRTLGEIQLARLSAQLRNVSNSRDVLRAFGEDPDRYASGLAKQYTDLANTLRQPARIGANVLPARLRLTLDRLADIFGWWEKVIAPNATVGLTQTPGGNQTGGTGIGAEIFSGSLALGGEIWNATIQEQWWVNTWQYVIPLPAVPATVSNPRSMSYRFNVPASVGFYRQDVISGSVHVYATIATSGDVNNHPVDFSQPVSSEFAIVATLPTPTVPPTVDGTAKITGSIQLVPGATPAVGVLIGLIISVAQGDVQILPGEFSFINLVPPDATMPSDIGKIEYRRDQLFWVEAVSKMLEQ